MNIRTSHLAIFAVAIGALLAACGGGGGGPGAAPPPPPPPPTGGITRSGIAVGPISNFGSVVVNGVRYDTAGATFTIDGAAGTEDLLDVGDVVTVVGSIDEDTGAATANQVFFDDAVTGPVDSVSIATSSLVVLGQTVFVTPDTSFDDSFAQPSLDSISQGDIVEVVGQFDANDDIVATRIEPKPAGTQFEVHGTVASLAGGAQTFMLSNLLVDFSGAMLDNFPAGMITDGDFVEAKGNAIGANDELIATRVEFETPFPDVNADDFAEIEGFITRFVDPTDFDVSGFPVTTNAQTSFEGGVAADLGLNIKVEVEGIIDANGLLVATKVDIRPSKAVRASAVVDSVDAPAGTVVVLGITVTTDALTRFEDKSSMDVDPLTIDAITAGNFVEIRGDEFPAGSGQIRATIFEREDVDDTELQGFVETITDPSFTILGVTIETNGTTVFRDENDAVISSTDFFARLAQNDLVKATGTESSVTTITATEVEFELEF
jgi:Domain of unknown function (DUF5666)